jgi:hypothetical protein
MQKGSTLPPAPEDSHQFFCPACKSVLIQSFDDLGRLVDGHRAEGLLKNFMERSLVTTWKAEESPFIALSAISFLKTKKQLMSLCRKDNPKS